MARRAAAPKSAKSSKSSKTKSARKAKPAKSAKAAETAKPTQSAGPRAGERARDEARTSGGPRMHGRGWHDHDTPKPLQPERMTGLDSMTEVESSGDRAGMGRRAIAARATQSRERRKRSVPIGKGIKTSASR